ncbi:MAG: UbiA family prenyltransferase [Candidatus Kariarchaeaceae archaeon]|jgi:geranylgeranylglycerol-phosphate geranylgeranyltransferase
MISAMALTGMWFGDHNVDLYKYFLALFVAITYTGIAMIHNDIIDLEIDKINAPHRVLPSGKATIKQASIFAVFLFFIGTIAGVSLLNIPSLIIMLYTLILSLIYNSKLKKTGFIGNVTVGFTATSAFLYGDAVSAGWDHFWPAGDWTASIYLFLISALLNTSREVCKGIMDTEGDQEYGVQTIAVRYGKPFAAKLVLVIVFLALIVAWVSVFVSQVFGSIFIIAIIAFLLLILMVGIPLVKDPNYETAKSFKTKLHPIMLMALILVVIDITI